MAIEFASTTLTITRSLVMTGAETSGVIQAAFLDDTSNNLYIVASADSGVAPFYWRRIDISNPLAITGNDWTPSNMSIPAATDTGDVDTLETQQLMFLDISTGVVWLVLSRNNVGEPAYHTMIGQINLGTGVVTYGTLQILSTTGTLVSGNPVRGVVKSGNFLYYIAQEASGAWTLTKTDVTAQSFVGSPPAIPTGTATGVSATASVPLLGYALDQATPVGMTLSADGKLLVYYDSKNKVEKYTTSLVFEGTTEWTSTDIGAMFFRNGFIWSLNNFNNINENLTLNRWLDGSTNVVSSEKSVYLTTERVVNIGENTSLPITFKAKDGFGAPLTGVAGQLVRFSIVTARGVIDDNDSALATASIGPFRDGSNIPINRLLTVALNSNAEATVYFQSARNAGGYLDIADTVRIEYPVV